MVSSSIPVTWSLAWRTAEATALPLAVLTNVLRRVRRAVDLIPLVAMLLRRSSRGRWQAAPSVTLTSAAMSVCSATAHTEQPAIARFAPAQLYQQRDDNLDFSSS